ncbi:polysaccharide biosynthesis protein [Marine Group I thaumarchaeote SCGC AAA799-B03]|uniref:Polysaccharide biosynthesis protein n=1 Tax=Marine Group I thaumarchaeote SCGC AAA799-B03 TaxID=1502289 RepID=A0A087S917_9ARCH|nr:polysaccharide biosynthesis protein [Marine Group I thaumarchaeote SCGC AAA799-B03]
MKFPTNDATQFKGFSLVSLGNIVAGIMGGGMWLFFATFMEVSDYGEVGFFISLGTVIGSLSVLGQNNVLLTYSYTDKNNELLYQALSFAIITSLIFTIAVIFIKWESAILLLSVSLFAISTSRILGKKKYKEYALVLITESSIRVGLSLLLYPFLDMNGILIAFALSHSITSYKAIKNIKGFTLSWNLLRQKFNFSLFSFGHSSTMLLPTLIDKIIIIHFFGTNSLGNYHLGTQLFSLVSILPISIFQFVLPQTKSGTVSRKLIIFLVVTSIIISIFFIILSPYLINTFYEEYVLIEFNQILGFAILPYCVTSLLNSKLYATDNSKSVFIGGMIYSISLFIGLIILGNVLGLVGMAIALVMSILFQTIFLFLSWQKLNK